MKIKSHKLVGVIMGSKSDWKTMLHCCGTLEKFGIKYEVKVISAHRTPARLHKFLNDAKRGGELIDGIRDPLIQEGFMASMDNAAMDLRFQKYGSKKSFYGDSGIFGNFARLAVLR